MPIPKTVKHDELLNAMQPLLNLLGVTAQELYSEPPMTIRCDRITFCVVPNPDAVKFPPGVPAPGGDDDAAELVLPREVLIEEFVV